MCARRNRSGRHILATAVLTGLQEYNQSRRPSPSSPSSSSRSFQEPMAQGISYIPPNYTDPIDPNPPAYEDIDSPGTSKNANSGRLVDEKQQLHRLSTSERVPPHVSDNYNPNTGLDDSIPRFIPPPTTLATTTTTPHAQPPLIALTPATTRSTTSSTSTLNSPHSQSLDHLLASITHYYDTQIKLHSSRPAVVKKLEYKKAKKLLKAEKKYNDHLLKGKEMKYEIKMEKRAEKMEKWADVMVKKSVGRHEKHVRKHGRCCDHVAVN
ncbi:hypothetical protein TWF718_002037 [Orbilia javanica]|uniref:Uncharacterized protein n=1 Tax=Orbilia javanica TaxID=47235 RepID=A0AAN8MZT1_9PEZI